MIAPALHAALDGLQAGKMQGMARALGEWREYATLLEKDVEALKVRLKAQIEMKLDLQRENAGLKSQLVGALADFEGRGAVRTALHEEGKACPHPEYHPWSHGDAKRQELFSTVRAAEAQKLLAAINKNIG